MPASTELSEAVLSQRRLLERLLVHGRRETGEEPSLRSPDARDAEFVKNLQIFQRLVVDADALCLRSAHGLSGDPAGGGPQRPGGRAARAHHPPHRGPAHARAAVAAASSWSGC